LGPTCPINQAAAKYLPKSRDGSIAAEANSGNKMARGIKQLTLAEAFSSSQKRKRQGNNGNGAGNSTPLMVLTIDVPD